MNGPRKTILFYPVSPVHVRNMGMLAGHLQDWEVRVVYNPRLAWFTGDVMASHPYHWVPFGERGEVPDEVWEDDVRAVVMSTAQVSRPSFNLITGALRRGISTVAVEEVNQLALQDRVVNNYMLPVDHLLVASENERQAFIETGVPAGHVEVTGWPFYSGLTETAGEDRKTSLLRTFALDPDRPVATLTLSMFAPSDLTGQEGPETRERLMSTVARGLPDEYQLLIKAHPAEDPATVVPFVEQYAPRARLLDRYTDINDVLDVSDVLFNQGISQVVIEALLRRLPVVVVPAGATTAFDGLLEDLVVREPADVARAISFIGNGGSPMDAYAPFSRAHMAIAPEDALELTARRIDEVARTGSLRDPAGKLAELAMWQAALLDRDEVQDTLDLLAEHDVDPDLASTLTRLVSGDAERDDVAGLLDRTGPGLPGYAVRSLWIDALCRRRLPVQPQDLEWMSDYPPRMMGTLFLRHAFRWAGHLLRCGHRQRAEEYVAGLASRYSHLETVRRSMTDFRMLVGKTDLLRFRPTSDAFSFVGHRLGYYGTRPGTMARTLRRLVGAGGR